ncbi:MAG TPA: NAD(P)/FAD-dependent oxidoreductase [Longimicrobium sp.]
MNQRNETFDAVVVGGGPAGLSAALTLGRGRWRVAVIDAGEPRNAPAAAAHNLFTRDGTPPLELLAIAREQLRPYDTVELRAGRAVDARDADGGFHVQLEDGSTLAARRVVLATGVVDILPDIPGFRQLWGKSVFHCPFCHGWEVRDQPLALLGRGSTAMELSRLLTRWSGDLVLLSDGPAELSGDERAELEALGVGLREERVLRLEPDGHGLAAVLDGGGRLVRGALYARPPQRQSSDLAGRLGCALTDLGLVQIDAMGATTVPGVFAGGDLVTRMQQVAIAASGGLVAAQGVHHSLAAENLARRISVAAATA